MAYIPKNKYTVLDTRGGQFRLVNTPTPYIGKYIQLTNGSIFAGEDPSNIIGALIPLQSIIQRNNIQSGINNNIYQILKPKLSDKQNNYIPIPQSSVPPNALDYSKGYYNRSLSVRLNTKKYQEISQITFNNYPQGNYNKSLNKVFQIEWSLNENNEDHNTKTLKELEYNLPGIFDFFPNKKQFGLRYGVVKIGETTRVYPTGELISNLLPMAYQTGNKQINTIDNPNVPSNQYCGNCIFNKKGHCHKWKASIKEQYWCRAYKVKVNSKPSEISKEVPPTPPPPQTTPLPRQQNTTASRGRSGY